MAEDIVKKIIESEKILSSYPDLHLYDDTRREALWILEVSSREFGVDRLTSSQVADLLVEKFGISRSSRGIGYALGKAANDGLVNKDDESKKFKIMEKGRKDLYFSSVDNPSAFYIEPGKPFSGKQILFDEILSQIRNKAWICDPHIGVRLLDILHKLEGSVAILIMTINIHGKSKFLRELKEFKREHPQTQVRVAPAGELHDRYIISDSSMWLVGHSLKDLGLKETFVIELGEGIRSSMEVVFEERWKASSAI